MFPSPLRHLRLLSPIATVAGLVMGTLPALAQTASTPIAGDCSAIHFELSNPEPGSRVSTGRSLIQGFATDNRAATGLGIDRVDFFLGDRDLGGLNVGSAALGVVPGPSGLGSFQTSLSLPKLFGGLSSSPMRTLR